VSNVPFGSDIHVRFVVKGSPAHVSTPSGTPGTRPGIRPVIRPPPRRRTWSRGHRFPVVFRPPAFASWAPCPAGKFRPDHSRPTTTAYAYPRTRRGPRHGFTTFHTRETRTGPGALFTPGMTVFAGHRVVRDRRLPPHNGRSLPPRHCVPARDVDVTRHQQEFPDSRPIPVLPLTCDRPGWDDGPWAFPWASHPTDQEPATHATVGTRSNTDPELRHRHTSSLLHELTHNVRLRVATTNIGRTVHSDNSRRIRRDRSLT
jgi:hypothetical protein